MIEPISQMFGLRDNRLMTDMTSWLEHTWVFELGFLQSAHETDPNAFYPMSCPICDPSCPKKNNSRPQTVIQMTEFRAGIKHGDPVTYNMKAMQRKNNWNPLNMPQLYRHISMKADTCPMHNIFEVVLHLLYFDSVLHHLPQFRNPCDGTTLIVTPTVSLDSSGQNTLLVQHNPYAR